MLFKYVCQTPCFNKNRCIVEEEQDDEFCKYCYYPIWKEISTKNKKERIKDLIEIIYDDNAAGGALHIVLDDGNIKDSDIKWCLENSIANMEEGIIKCIYKECAELLLQISYSKRKKIYERQY